MKRRRRELDRPRWARALPQDSAPPHFYRKFGRVNPELARAVAAEVQVDAVNRFELVENVVLSLAHRLGFCRTKVYKYLRAGRWLKTQEVTNK